MYSALFRRLKSAPHFVRMEKFKKKTQNILGMNARNLLYLYPYNSKRAIQLADNKLRTKKVLNKAKIPVPEVYNVVTDRYQLDEFNWESLPNSFVLKPNRGLGGEGILIVYGRKKGNGNWVKADRTQVAISDLRSHVLNIFEGNFSLYGMGDIAFFEQRVKMHKVFKPYSFRGIPDIRVIVFNRVPVMAELRLPTEESKGKSNLHLGGIGVGIDIGSGVTTFAVRYNELIEYVPEKRLAFRGVKIPHWQKVLELAVEAQVSSRVGFLGVDIAIDRELGPMVVELNARAGLSIQVANLCGLRERLKRVEGLEVKTVLKGVKIAQELFGGEVEEELEEISGRRVIGINEPIEILDSQGKKHPTVAKVDTGAYRTTLAENLAKEFGLEREIRRKKVRGALGKQERPIINFSFILDKRLVQTEAFIADRSQMKYDIIVGRRDLKRFLVDPAKNVLVRRKLVEK